MSLSRADVEALWERIDNEAVEAKSSPEATTRLVNFYRGLDNADRAVIDGAAADWVVGDDERRRFDALALIREFEIRSTLPALRARIDALPCDGTGRDAAEREKLGQLVKAISS